MPGLRQGRAARRRRAAASGIHRTGSGCSGVRRRVTCCAAVRSSRIFRTASGRAARSAPTWLLTIVVALAFVGLVGGVYWLVGAMKGSPAGAAAKQLAAAESPAAKPGSSPSPYQKYIEISGIRFLENAKKKPEVRFVVTNHSGAAIDGLSGNVTIWARTRKSEEEAAGTFQFTTNIGAWETKDLSVPLSTKLQMIELPDWQNTTADVQITAPR